MFQNYSKDDAWRIHSKVLWQSVSHPPKVSFLLSRQMVPVQPTRRKWLMRESGIKREHNSDENFEHMFTEASRSFPKEFGKDF